MSRLLFIAPIIIVICILWYGINRTPSVPVEANHHSASSGVVRAASPKVTLNVVEPTLNQNETTLNSIVHDQPALSREEAKTWLQDVLIQSAPSSMPFPELDLRPEDTASPAERAQILESRRLASLNGTLLIVARFPDGTLHFWESRHDFPRTFFPPHVRRNLTEEDWEAFQVAMEVASIQASVKRLMKEKRPNKAPEPTTGAVTPRATEGASK